MNNYERDITKMGLVSDPEQIKSFVDTIFEDAKIPIPCKVGLPKDRPPTAKECIAYVSSCGWTYEGRNCNGNYTFSNPGATSKTLYFSLNELREAKKVGW